MDRKSIIGLLLIGLVLIGYNYLAPSAKPEEEQNNTEEVTDTVQAEVKSEETVIEVTDTVVEEEVSDSALLAQIGNEAGPYKKARAKFLANSPENTVLENNKIRIELSNFGGQIKSVWLKEYQTFEEYKERGYIKEDVQNAMQLFDGDSSVMAWDLPGLTSGFTSADLAFDSKVEETAVTYTLSAGAKEFSIRYEIVPDRFDVKMSVGNKGFTQAELDQMKFNWFASMNTTEQSQEQQRNLSAVFYYTDEDRYDYIAETRDGDEIIDDNKLKWVAYKQGYFSAILKAPQLFKVGAELEGQNVQSPGSKYVSKFNAKLKPNLNAGQGTAFEWYFGPNDYDLLKTYDDGTEDIINWGWGIFRWINKFLINPVYDLLSINWGLSIPLAILILTILVKVLLMPINYKMYKQSAKMRVIKPELEELNKKWEGKDDKLGKQQEQMTMMNEMGVNQFAGCLPSLAQMPILIAVFRYFPSLVTLRQEKFLWAVDLSSYDSIVDLSFSIPLYGDHVSLFTILMSVVVLINTFLTSGQMQQPQQEGMPNMKVIMYFFPIMMIFFFNNYSSGLSYYYFISTLLSIVIMYFIKTFLIDEKKIRAQIDANKANPEKRKKSGFQARLAEMQKLQQEQAKQQKRKK